MQSVIHLNSNTFDLFPPVYAVQNDTGRELKMVLDDLTLAGTETGAVAIKRSDGSYYTITATLVAADNAFTIDMDQALTQPGKTECQLKVTESNNDVISSYTFVIFVQPSTDGVPQQQLGVSVEELMDAAAQLTLSDNDVKLALLQIAEKVVYIDEHGQDYYDALEDALYPPIRATSVTLNKNSLVFGGVGGTDTLVATVSPNNVEDDTVYWGSSDKDVAVVSDGIVTAVAVGSCTITATCGTKHASASVSVAQATLVSISASYTQTGTIYDSDSLDDILTAGTLVVTATWSDSSQTTVSNDDVTLSGSLTTGTSTITASYGGESDTFSVTVTHDMSALPAGYTKYDYIQNTQTGSNASNLYIDTGLSATYGTQDYEHEILFANVTSTTNASSIYGLRLASGNINNSRTIWVKSNNNQVIYANHDSGYTYASSLDEKVKIKTTADGSNAYVYVNDVLQSTVTKTSFSPVSGGTFFLFGVRQTSPTNAEMGHKAKIYSFTVKEISSGDYVAYFVPCTDSNNVPGYYDTVRQQFYTASAPTKLTAGND